MYLNTIERETYTGAHSESNLGKHVVRASKLIKTNVEEYQT